MRICLRYLPFVTIVILIAACGNNNSSDKKTTTGDTVESMKNNTVEKQTIADERRDVKKCFTSEGLKYTVTITLFTDGNDIRGNVTSTETGSDKIEKAKFTGKKEGNTLTVSFHGTPPVAGDASEWTTKPWTLEEKEGKEKLLIPFNAKNYETNKWEEMKYEFIPCEK